MALGDFFNGTPAIYWGGHWQVQIPTAAAASSVVYFNRKFHSPSGSYHYWQTDAPDPTMSQTTPPNPAAEYSDYVIINVRG